MKIVIEGTIEECADAIHKLSEVLPCTRISTDRHELSAEFQEANLPCPHSRPSWRMCPHCNGSNDAARAAQPQAELVYLPEATTNSTSIGPTSTGTIYDACPHMRIAYGQCLDCSAQVSRT
jgi:hypothetical protein